MSTTVQAGNDPDVAPLRGARPGSGYAFIASAKQVSNTSRATHRSKGSVHRGVTPRFIEVRKLTREKD